MKFLKVATLAATVVVAAPISSNQDVRDKRAEKACVGGHCYEIMVTPLHEREVFERSLHAKRNAQPLPVPSDESDAAKAALANSESSPSSGSTSSSPNNGNPPTKRASLWDDDGLRGPRPAKDVYKDVIDVAASKAAMAKVAATLSKGLDSGLIPSPEKLKWLDEVASKLDEDDIPILLDLVAQKAEVKQKPWGL